MHSLLKAKQIILVVGDVLALYIALALTLIIRYQNPLTQEVLKIHLEPFSVVFIFWILIFYIIGLYEIRALKGGTDFVKKFGTALSINAISTIVFFYFIPSYNIAPKTNLFIFLIVIFAIEYFWRNSYNDFLKKSAPAIKTLFIGASPASKQLFNSLKQNPQLGYEPIFTQDTINIFQTITSERINLVVMPAYIKNNPAVAKTVYKNLVTGTAITSVSSFYETILGKVPISELEEFWFVEDIVNRNKTYDLFRVPLEILWAIILGVIFLPLAIIIAALIKITSAGPIVIKQKRVGELGRPFVLYKFRSMIAAAEAAGAQWAKDKDSRITPLGKILRRSHLDEIPQLINIIKGDLSFVGPRPERPEFVEQLKNLIPYYELRHVVKPGLTGWAQLNYRYGASIEEAYEKLQYDLYYLKNRSFWLDLSIIIKTIKLFFTKN